MSDDCTGAYDCPATEHIHGCFRDIPCRHSTNGGVNPNDPQRWTKICSECGVRQENWYRQGTVDPPHLIVSPGGCHPGAQVYSITKGRVSMGWPS